EEVVRRIDPQRLLEDPKRAVAGDVEREEPGNLDLARPSKPDQRSGEHEVPDDLVEEGGLEGAVLEVARRAMRHVDLQPPGQRGRPAEQLLVEVVADPPDRLCDEHSGGAGVHELRDARSGPADPPDPDERAERDPTPDSKPSRPDRERPPPMRRNLVPTGDEEVQAPADDTCGEAPQRHV